MIIKRVDSTDKDFQKLVRSLDADLAIRDGDDRTFYHQFNKIDLLKNCIVIYMDKHAVACGAFKAFSENSVEIKGCIPVLKSENLAWLPKYYMNWRFGLKKTDIKMCSGDRYKAT